MGKSRPGWRQVGVLHLEPQRSAATVGCIVMGFLAVAVVVAALAYRTDSWPEAWRPTEPVPDLVPLIRVLAIALMISAFSVVPLSRLRRDLNFQRRLLPDTEPRPTTPFSTGC